MAKLIDNPVYKSPVKVNLNLLGDTGTTLYCNGFGGLEKIDNMDEDLREMLESTKQLPGNTILIQLKNFFKTVAGGPWFIDLVNGILFIHNRNWTDPTIHKYTYYQEHGEVLSASFSLQDKFQGKSRVVKSTAYNPLEGILEQIRGGDPKKTPNWIIKNDPIKAKEGELVPNHIHLNYSTRVNNIYKNNPQAASMEAQAKVAEKNREEYRKAVEKEEFKRRVKEFPNNYNKSAYLSSPKVRSKSDAEAYVKVSQVSPYRAFLEVFSVYKKENPNSSLNISDASELWESSLHEAVKRAEKGQLKTDNVTEAALEIFNDNIEGPKIDFNSSIQMKFNDEMAQVGSQRLKFVKVQNVADWENEVKAMGYTPYSSFTGNTVVPGRGRRTFINGVESVTGKTGLWGETGWYVAALTPYNDGKIRTATKKQFLEAAVANDPLFGQVQQILSMQAQQRAMDRRVRAIENFLKKGREKELTATLEVVGRPSLIAARYIELYNVGKNYSGKWYVKQCEHKFNTQTGYITTLNMVRR